MDLLKDEEKLVEKKQKALENLQRKQKYLAGAQTSFRKARREFKIAVANLRTIRKQIKAEGIERPVVIHTPGVEPISITEPEPIEESND